MKLSIIIPALNEEDFIEECLRSALAAGSDLEVVVVDGGSTDSTLEKISHFPQVRTLTSKKGRGAQMNRGGEEVSGEVLLFLHADCRLPPHAADAIEKALDDPQTVGGFFKVQFVEKGLRFRLIDLLLNLRASYTRGGTGDQGIFVRRAVFDRLGGYTDIPLFEDLDLIRRMKRIGRIAVIDSPIRASARRWVEHGYLKTVLLMWSLRLLYLAGVPPSRLARLY